MEANKVFRQAVLDRLASPEQLHTLMQVTDAKGWFALVGSGVLIVTALVWGVFGHVPTKIEASGILMHAGGLADVVAIGAGQIMSVDVDVGDYVTKGQLVAKVAQPELNEQLNGLESKLVELKANFESSKAAGSRDQSLRANEASKERQNLEASILQNEQRSHELEEKLVTQSGLYAKGLVTNEALQSTRDALRSTQVAVDGMRANQQHLEVDSFSAERVNDAMLMGQTMQTQETERQISLLKEKLEQSSQITTTHEGRVVEVRAMVGDLVTPGLPIVSIERAGEKGSLEALLYVDSREGKIVRPGMEVELAPSIVRKERYGVLLGKVRTVESFPSTRQGMMHVLHNDQLVDAFLSDTAGTPIAVRAELRPAPNTPSGYKWSSGAGPDLILTSGTRCAAYVTTRTQRPIALVFPSLDYGG
ncbi:MAG TPA: NHLP bacteriocin system secretion protein [Polyangiaceae bacterium]|jgi:HlyD family secretion protein|nr:NHLP bacteriocin system secretion protein [Polyangiaceae bacterium]